MKNFLNQNVLVLLHNQFQSKKKNILQLHVLQKQWRRAMGTSNFLSIRIISHSGPFLLYFIINTTLTDLSVLIVKIHVV